MDPKDNVEKSLEQITTDLLAKIKEMEKWQEELLKENKLLHEQLKQQAIGENSSVPVDGITDAAWANGFQATSTTSYTNAVMQANETATQLDKESTKHCEIRGQDDHFSVECEGYREMRMDERYNTARRKGLCLNCMLTKSHIAKDCELKPACGFKLDKNIRCSAKHHNSLHKGTKFSVTRMEVTATIVANSISSNMKPVHRKTRKNRRKIPSEPQRAACANQK